MIAVILLALTALYATTFYDQTVSMRETEYDVVYHGTIGPWAAATDTYYTQAMFIGDCNLNDAYAMAYTNAETGDDINVDVEYSIDRETWKAMTVNSGHLFDDVHDGTLQTDTLNVNTGAADPLYSTAIWVRLKCIGQTGNPTTATLTWALHFTKKVEGKVGSSRVKDRIS